MRRCPRLIYPSEKKCIDQGAVPIAGGAGGVYHQAFGLVNNRQFFVLVDNLQGYCFWLKRRTVPLGAGRFNFIPPACNL